MIRQGDRHLCEWRYGMASRFWCALFAAMMAGSEGDVDRLSQGFPEEVDAYRRYQKDRSFWPQIEAEWKASWPALYGAKTGAPDLRENVAPPARKLKWNEKIVRWLVRLP